MADGHGPSRSAKITPHEFIRKHERLRPLTPHPRPLLSRRSFLQGGAALGSAAVASRSIISAAATKPAGSDLGAIEHVIFVMQENRSFDHYFGSYRMVRGFDDHGAGDLAPFDQNDPANQTRLPSGTLLPFHFDSKSGVGECTRDINHGWDVQHRSWNAGAMDSFVSEHISNAFDGPDAGQLTMGYYTRSDLPFHYALADAFTICDGYFSSIMGPTHPNRIMALSGTIDPAGLNGGPILTTMTSTNALFSLRWVSVPELLQDRGVSWKTYTTAGQGFLPKHPTLGFGDSVLQFFAPYKKPSGALHKRAFLPTYPGDFVNDVARNTLPHVSWINSPNGYDEHPPSPPAYGAWFLSNLLRTLVAHPKVWAKTVIFITYDESGGFFDHVPPPTPPLGTPGEYITASPLPGAARGVAGPLGLGFRVPMLVVSPFSHGGIVVSDVFDHTSQIRFLERRFGIHASTISPWRRRMVGDLSSTLRMSRPMLSPPRLPSSATFRKEATTVMGCTPTDVTGANTAQTPYPIPSPQTMPTQET